MHFIIKYKNLLKIKNLLSVFSSTSIGEKNENFLLSCEKNEIIIYLNNGFISCKLIINEDVQIINTNKIFLNIKIFSSLIDNLKDYEEIEFSSNEENLLEISSKKFSCNLVCIKEQNYIFDEYSIDENYKKISIPYNNLKVINNRLKEFCRSFNNTLNKDTLLNYINLKKDKDNSFLYVSSTDSYRIIFGKFEQFGEEFNINVHPLTINNIITLFSEFENEIIDIYYWERNLIIKTNNITFKSNLFIGNFPNFLEWFANEPKIIFEINKNKLISSLDRTLFLSNQNLKTTYYKLKKNQLIIEYKDSEKGFSKEEIEVNNIKNENIDFSLNSLLLKQLIKNINSDEIIFYLTESLKPVIICGKFGDDNFQQLILPLKN